MAPELQSYTVPGMDHLPVPPVEASDSPSPADGSAPKRRLHPRERVGLALILMPFVVQLVAYLLKGSNAMWLLILPMLFSGPAFFTGIVLVILGYRDRHRQNALSASGTPIPPPPGAPQASTRRTTGNVLTSFGAAGCTFAALGIVMGVLSSNAFSALIALACAVVVGLPSLVMLGVGLAMRRRG